MLRKFTIVVAIEIVIGIISFLIAGKNNQFVDIASIFMFLSIVCAFIFLVCARFSRAKLN